MQDVSGFGLTLSLIASNTFPTTLRLSQFADDSDPIDFPSMPIGQSAMGLNGDLIYWSKANPLKATVAVIEGSQDAINLDIIYEANRVGRGKTSAQDVITLAVVYPSGNVLTLSPGKMVEGMPGVSVASAGRLKTKVYHFEFENKTGVAG